MIERQQIFINGEWVDPSSDEVAVVINPATELPVASIRLASPADVDQAVAAASAALPDWSHTSAEHRAQVLRSLADLIEVRADEASHMMTTEMGQPITTALGTTAGAIQDLRIFADALKDVVWTETVGGAEVHKVAAGVVGVITAWNVPLRTVAVKIGAALAAGCTTVLKGSEIAPLTSYLVADLAQQAGIPAGVFNLVSGTGPVVGEAIAAHPLVDMVSLTGSVRAGSRVMELASRSIKRVGLELGGKSANVILDDADVEKAVSVGIVDALRNGGQACGGLTRVLVPRPNLGVAEEAAASAAASFRLGDPLDPATTMGPMSTKGQRDRVRGYIRTGIDEGARLVVGGPEQPESLDVGFYVKPTVFTGDNSMRIAREEIFGPVVVLIPFEDEAEAVNLANDSEYGLAGAVWSASPDRARAVASRIRTGRVVINGAPVERAAPHGGFKRSGIGREWGRFGIEDYLELQAIHG